MRAAQGEVLGDRYRLVRRIAIGGMGEVWVAHDESLARDVAIKVLREEFAGDTGFLSRFRTEARNSASLSHQNIAQLYDYGEQDGSAFLVQELVVGEPMSDLLEREPVLPTQRLLPILAQTARALHAAHSAGVVHRDVKPGNILLGRGGRVKITDFGVSLATNQVPMTATGMVMGTAQYLSPEQAVGKPATASSDLYSLGIVAYESLAGHRPFTGPTAVDIAVAHVNTPVPPLPQSVEPRLAALVMRLLSKEPADRPRSAAELAHTLDGMVEQTPPTGIHVVVTDPRVASSGRRVDAEREVEREIQREIPPRPAPVPVVVTPPVRPAGPAVIPPSYPPRRELRDQGEQDARRSAGSHRATSEPATRRTSTTTGTRMGRLTWPFVALMLLLIALLGAALAQALTRADGPSSDPTGHSSVLAVAERPLRADDAGYPRPRTEDGMISECVPGDPGILTTTKDA
ncbi:MAG: serine/threonine-protein kinase [Cellulomonas sp.]